MENSTGNYPEQVERIADDLRHRLRGVQDHGHYFKAFCPAHPNTNTQALSVELHPDGVGVKCHAGCTSAQVCEAVGLQVSDLFVKAELVEDSPTTSKARKRGRTPEAEYVYTDANGRPYMRVLRFPGKDFRQQAADEAGGWQHTLNGRKPILYRLPELVEPTRIHEPVFIVEGEKDADNLATAGLLATTAPMGAGKWSKIDPAPLRDRRELYVLPDNDEPGRKHAHDIVASLPRACTVELPDLAPGGDVSDWLTAGGTPEKLLELARVRRDQDRPAPISAADLMAREFAPVQYVIADVLPPGVTLLAGKPKKGKSWMSLAMCQAIAAGGKAFGCMDVRQGGTLYLALEDNFRRLQDRLRKVLAGSPAPPCMHLHTEWPRLDEGGLELLAEYLDEHPDTRLVVIDTLAKIRKPASGKNVYSEDYEALKGLLPLAAAHEVAIVIVHHLRKEGAEDAQDEISGSTGLAGGVDNYMILRHKAGKFTLHVDGRDIEKPAEYALAWNLDTASWIIEGEAEQVHISKERAAILDVLRKSGKRMNATEITHALGGETEYNSVRQLLWKMSNDMQLKKDGHLYYQHPDNTSNTNNSSNISNTDNTCHLLSGGNTVDNTSDNTRNADVYAENGASVNGFIGVTGIGDNRPLSDELRPGESATLPELRGRREERELRQGEYFPE